MGLPLRTTLFWAVFGRLGGVSLLQLPAERIPAARARRARSTRLPGAWLVTGRVPAGVDIVDRSIGLPDGDSIGVRVYTPSGPAPVGGRPLVVNYHGGGWVAGDAQQSQWWCASLAAGVDAVVVSVDYRLAPEHRFPGPLEDCYAATCWAVEHAGELGADPQRLAVTGDSAGGNLAAAVCLLARDRGGPRPVFQLLVYPAVELVRDFPSAFENADAPLLTKADLDHAPTLYCRSEAELTDPLASPLRAELAGLPPALVQTAQYDPLRDQGPAYVEALRAAGVEARCVDYDGAIHGYISIPGAAPAARRALADATAALRAVFGGR